MTTRESLECLTRAVDGEPLDRRSATALAECLARDPERILEPLLEAGCELGRRGHGNEITVSRNVFIPLTNLCRNRCAYCTFAVVPDDPHAKTYTPEEVRDICRSAVANGCREALFCLGDKPEIAYRGYRSWLAGEGYLRTTDYLVEACELAFRQGLFPHTNAGILSIEEMAALRPYNASMGLMLESTSPRLRERGQAHYYAPDKDPELRLRMTREAGELKIPFTSGLLIGIGETPAERVETLCAIREMHARGGHIQEVIVQNFHPKPGTPMAAWNSPSDAEMAGTVALARLVLGAEMNLQAPPNLSPTSLERLARSGLNDWGGVSPVTVDFINPEAPWPELDRLRELSESAGYVLRERHAVYPSYIAKRPDFFAPAMLRRLLEASDDKGYPKNRTRLRAHDFATAPVRSA